MADGKLSLLCKLFSILPGNCGAFYKNMNYGSTGELKNTTAWADLCCGVEEARQNGLSAAWISIT